MNALQAQLSELQVEYEQLQANYIPENVEDLERRVRELYVAAAGNDALQIQARDLLRKTRELRQKPESQSESPVEMVNKARVRINLGGTVQDFRDAIDMLDNVLRLDPDNVQAVELLESIALKSPSLKNEVIEMLRRLSSSQAREAVERIDKPSQTEPSRSKTESTSSTASPRAPASDEVEILQKQLIDIYYQGEYRRTIQICNSILSYDPDNRLAKEYKAKAEDYIQRGVVPDVRLPLDARIAFNRGTSAIRASQYEEAKVLFESALRTAKGSGIDYWKDAEEALQQIDNLALSKDLRDAGDRLVAKDRWEEALESYENALAVIDEPRARRKYELLSHIVKQHKRATVQVALVSGQLLEMANTIVELRSVVNDARVELPESQKLLELVATVEARARDVRARLQERGETLLAQSDNAPAVSERLRLAQDSLQNLEAAHALQPEDSNTDNVRIQAQAQVSKLENIKAVIEGARQRLSKRDSSSLNEIRAALEDLTEYAEDPVYRSTVATLHHQVLEQAQLALEHKDLLDARSWLTKAEDRPFNILGRSHDVKRLEKILEEQEGEISRAKTQKQLRKYGALAGGILGVIVLFALTSTIWRPLLFPTATATPTVTPTSTPMPTVTPTDVPTPTSVPSPTPLAELCFGVTKGDFATYPVRENPDARGTILGNAPRERRVRILDQVRDKDGQQWYKIDYGDQDVIQQGWILARYVTEATECPRLP